MDSPNLSGPLGHPHRGVMPRNMPKTISWVLRASAGWAPRRPGEEDTRCPPLLFMRSGETRCRIAPDSEPRWESPPLRPLRAPKRDVPAAIRRGSSSVAPVA